MFVILSGLLTAYGTFSYLAYSRYNPSRLWVPMLCSAVYTMINIDGWLSWPAVIVTVVLFMSWRKRSNGVDTGYRVIADLTSGRFGVPRQKSNEPSSAVADATTVEEHPRVVDNGGIPEAETNDNPDRFAPPAEGSDGGSAIRVVGKNNTVSTSVFHY